MAGSTDAGHDEKVAGVVAQVRADSPQHDSEGTERLLRQRFDETGLEVSEEDIARHLEHIRNGPSVE